jgi:hypothetical protein
MGQHYKLHALLWERRAGAGPAEDAGRAPVLIAERDASFPLHHLIFPYYAEGCMASCMRDHIIRYFPQVLIAKMDGEANEVRPACSALLALLLPARLLFRSCCCRLRPL